MTDVQWNLLCRFMMMVLSYMLQRDGQVLGGSDYLGLTNDLSDSYIRKKK